MQLGRKGKRNYQVGTCAPGRDSEDKEEYKGGDPPWGVSILSHILGIPVLGSDIRKMSPLGWLEGHWD